MAEGLYANIDNTLAAMAKIFAHEGQATEVAVLAYSQSRIEHTDFVESEFGNPEKHGYSVYRLLPAHHFAQARLHDGGLYQWLYVIAQHARRHVQQMGEIERPYRETPALWICYLIVAGLGAWGSWGKVAPARPGLCNDRVLTETRIESTQHPRRVTHSLAV
jgi:hypothetical protein